MLIVNIFEDYLMLVMLLFYCCLLGPSWIWVSDSNNVVISSRGRRRLTYAARQSHLQLGTTVS